MSDLTERFFAGSYEAGGVAFAVWTNRPGLAARVRESFRDLHVTDSGSTPVFFEVLYNDSAPRSSPWGVWRNGEQLEATVADFYVLNYLLWEVTRLMFKQTGDRLHLHGAALVLDGRAVVLAGRSEAGKSTLAGWLTYRGWGFLTDEAALVDPVTLTVEPFWRPIGVRRPGPLDSVLGFGQVEGPGDAECLVPASTFGALAPAAPLAALAYPAFTPGRPAMLSALSPAAALVELTQHFPGLIVGGRAGFRRLADLVRAVPAHTLQFHDLDDAERVLREAVGARS